MFDLLNEHLGDQDTDVQVPKSVEEGKLPVPTFRKFSGDGALMLWARPKGDDFPQSFCNLVVETMRRFQSEVERGLPACEKKWRVHNLPARARVGITCGIVYALRPPHLLTSWTDPCDYVGYCINLAVRLQDHCPDLGFLVHGDLHPELPGMTRCSAVKIKGAQEEPVSMFSDDMARVPKAEFDAKFRRDA